MCCRTQFIGGILAALGAGLLLSCLFDGWLICFVFGAVLIAVGLLLGNR